MKLIRILLIIMLLITPIAITGCEESVEDNVEVHNANEFIKIEDNGIYIIVHKDTRVMYMFVNAYKKGGLVVMVDAEGKPLLYEGEID